MEGARHWGAEDSPGLRDHAVPHHHAARAGVYPADLVRNVRMYDVCLYC